MGGCDGWTTVIPLDTADQTPNEEPFSDEATGSTTKRTDTTLVEAVGLASRPVATTPPRGAG
jgi:hypothetical protein